MQQKPDYGFTGEPQPIAETRNFAVRPKPRQGDSLYKSLPCSALEASGLDQLYGREERRTQGREKDLGVQFNRPRRWLTEKTMTGRDGINFWVAILNRGCGSTRRFVCGQGFEPGRAPRPARNACGGVLGKRLAGPSLAAAGWSVDCLLRL